MSTRRVLFPDAADLRTDVGGAQADRDAVRRHRLGEVVGHLAADALLARRRRRTRRRGTARAHHRHLEAHLTGPCVHPPLHRATLDALVLAAQGEELTSPSPFAAAPWPGRSRDPEGRAVNPFGGCFPPLLQFPVLIGLFYVVRQPLKSAPCSVCTQLIPNITDGFRQKSM